MPIFQRKKESQTDSRLTGSKGRRVRLLVVDENPTALEVMGRRLSHAGHDVILANGAGTAMGLLMARQFDLIIIESEMRVLSGISTMKKMRDSGLIASDLPIMLMTPRSVPSATIEALDAGADDQISRPFDFDVLEARIRHLVGKADRLDAIARHNQALDARIARRAVELGEARLQIEEMQVDRQRLVASIQTLHNEIERLHSQ